jgi:transcriptional regulator with XRE-family HTH domain
MKELRVKVLVYNNRLLSRREALGVSQKQMAEIIGVAFGAYADLERAASVALTKDGQWSKHALACSEYYDVAPEELFPECVVAMRKNSATCELSGEDLVQLLHGRPAPRIGDEGKTAALLLSGLSERERSILATRYGFDGGEGKTLTETGEHYEISTERVRQIELRALRRIRHPRLKPALDRLIDIVEEAQ